MRKEARQGTEIFLTVFRLVDRESIEGERWKDQKNRKRKREQKKTGKSSTLSFYVPLYGTSQPARLETGEPGEKT